MQAVLILENGASFPGEAPVLSDDCFELTFNTSMIGYTEIISDPAYMKQGIVMTYPVIGNYGICTGDIESERIWTKALVMRKLSHRGSNFRSNQELAEFLTQHNVLYITGIDTRKLTKILVENGTQRAMLADINANIEEKVKILREFEPKTSVFETGTNKLKKIIGNGSKIAVFDFGITNSMLRGLTERGADISIFPPNTEANTVLGGGYDGVFLSSGPEAADGFTKITAELKIIADSGIPVFAVGLGHQLLALAYGAKIEKLRTVHCGANHPVMDTEKNRVYITTQNQRFTVVKGTLPESAKITHIHINDKTIEGIRYSEKIFSASFYPDLSGGIISTSYMFDEFINMAGGTANA